MAGSCTRALADFACASKWQDIGARARARAPAPPPPRACGAHMIARRTAAKLIRFRPDSARATLPVPAAAGDAAEIEPLMTAADVGHVLQLPKKRVYEVVGHLAIQIAP